MSDKSHSAERRRNIWAPWRIEYIDTLHEDRDDGCFLCRYRQEPRADQRNLVLWRGRHSLALLNRFPYTGGHSLIAPFDHAGELDELDGPVMLEMMEMVRDLQLLLSNEIQAEGFNVGMNIGRCAGAGLPGHLHIHVVPRWTGDTNFMAVLGGASVIPQTLRELYERLGRASGRLDLPRLSS